MALLDILKAGLPYLLGTVPAAKQKFEGQDLSAQKRIAGQMENLSSAMINPNDPMYQKIYQQQRGEGQQDLAATIAEISRQNRKLNIMGRRPLLDQERGGESVFRNLISAQQGIGQQARDATLEQLQAGQRSLAPVYDSYQGISQGNLANAKNRAEGYNNLADILKYLFNLNQKKPVNSGTNPFGAGRGIFY